MRTEAKSTLTSLQNMRNQIYSCRCILHVLPGVSKNSLFKDRCTPLENFGGEKGTATGQYIIYLKAWGTICQTSSTGELGLQRMKDVNIALLIKLGRSVLVQEEKTLGEISHCEILAG